MRRAWLVLLAGCGFKSQLAKQVDPDADPDPSAVCWRINDPTFGLTASACATALDDAIDLTMDVSINTDATGPQAMGLRCATLDASDTICALVASSIKIGPRATLSASGTNPLALLAHSIEIQGTIDIASHLQGQVGPASLSLGCSPGRAATLAGGGAGGRYGGAGGDGGEQGGATGTAGLQGSSISSAQLRGGCNGGRGGNGTSSGGPSTIGGAGGGALWIGIDVGALVLGPAAIINASGAGGRGGPSSTVHGGDGGGSGGLIILQAPTIALDPAARIFANGGAGGGGSQGGQAGGDGTDSTGPASGGIGGTGGAIALDKSAGDGGAGFPDRSPNGAEGNHDGSGGGGGGGGGGAGVIRVASTTPLAGPNISPQPIPVTH